MRNCDIVVPVFNAYDFVIKCIDSVLKNTDFSKTRLILIDDKSSDERVLPMLEKYETTNPEKIILLKNKKNLGFVKTVNKGMKHSKNDILLLNSDAIVSKNWLEKLSKCAYMDDRIATTTPLSNNQTPVALLDEAFRKNGFLDGHDFDETAKIIEKYSMRLYPEVPSSHGFCMYIKREALKKVGYFDAKTFGKGYGEENDFCFRCFKFGYYHVICDDTYVFHAGAKSFLSRKFHNDELTKKHPKTMVKVGEWYRDNNLKKISDNIVLAAGSNNKYPNLLILSNDDNFDIMMEKCNIHILNEKNKHLELKSIFDNITITTAIYDKPMTMLEKQNINIEKIQIIEEIINIFGISMICGLKFDKVIKNICKKNGVKYMVLRDKYKQKHIINNIDKISEKKKIDFLRARNKMLECNLIKN